MTRLLSKFHLPGKVGLFSRIFITLIRRLNKSQLTRIIQNCKQFLKIGKKIFDFSKQSEFRKKSHALLHLVYPALCIHCKALLMEPQKYLCSTCSELLTLIHKEQRCQKCFKECGIAICKECQKHPSTYSKLGVCFEHIGPAASIIREFENRLFLDRSIASWLIVQMDKMTFPMPTLILPFPHRFTDKILEGYNKAELLAQEIGKLYQIPVKDLLRGTEDNQFLWKRSVDISDQDILLVVEQITAIELIRGCAATIQEGYPRAVNVIAFSAYGV